MKDRIGKICDFTSNMGMGQIQKTTAAAVKEREKLAIEKGAEGAGIVDDDKGFEVVEDAFQVKKKNQSLKAAQARSQRKA